MRKEPLVLRQTAELLAKLGADYGIEAVHKVYRDCIAEMMACRERSTWQDKIRESQTEVFGLLESL